MSLHMIIEVGIHCQNSSGHRPAMLSSCAHVRIAAYHTSLHGCFQQPLEVILPCILGAS